MHPVGAAIISPEGEAMIGGRYRMGRAIGRGGMGEVFLAEDTVLGREVAVKHIAKTDEDQATATERLLREARSAARIRHPNVVTVHDLVVEESAAYIIMEYVPAENLAQVLRRGPIGPERAARIGAQVADALDAAHKLGVVHRDVKPSNILVASGDLAKLTDFGVARVAGDTGLTRTGHMIGSIAYMPPEVARGAEATTASDLYSLGATLYAAVEGHAPFADDNESSTSVAMLVRLVTEKAPPPTKAGALTDLITRLLSVDPSRRPSAAQTAELLRTATAPAVPTTAAPPEAQDEDEALIKTRIRPATPAAPPAVVSQPDEPPVVEVDEPEPQEPPASPSEVDPTVRRQAPPVAASTPAPASAPSLAQAPPEMADRPARSRPLTPNERQDRRRRRALLAGAGLVVLAIAAAGTYLWSQDQTAAWVGDTTIARSTVTEIAEEIRVDNPDLVDGTDELDRTVLEVMIQSEVSEDLLGELFLTITPEQRSQVLADSPSLGRLLDNSVTEDFARRYADTHAAVNIPAFASAFPDRLRSTPIKVNPRYGTWSQEQGQLVSPHPSATATP